MRKRQLIAGVMLAVMALSTIGAGATPISAVETAPQSNSYTFNDEGLWLTEIYQNDVNRSKQNSNYLPIKTYASGDNDVMEFIEITSTYDEAVSLNSMYDVYYGSKVINFTDMAGSSDITINAGETFIIWNSRGDLGITLPTEAELREELDIADGVRILKGVTGAAGGGWSADGAVFSLKTKSDGAAISTFKAVTAVNTADGLSVELKIPDLGNEMEVYRNLTLPSAGIAYSGQLNGLGQAKVTDESSTKGVFITEVRPNDIDRASAYGTGDDYMECLEIINTTDHAVDLNTDYQLAYVIKEGQVKPLTLYTYDESAAGHVGSSDNSILKAGQTAVLWCYRESYLTEATSFPTEADFRSTYNISDDVAVYMFTNQNGLGNTNRSFQLYKLGADSRTLVSSYSWDGTTDCKNNKSVTLQVNPEGPEMLVLGRQVTSTMGVVDPTQYAYLKDDGSSMTIRLADGESVPESVMQGEDIRVNFHYEVSAGLPRTGITTYYRFDGEGSWYSSTEATRRVPNLYEVKIPADQLFSHDYVEFYVSADNRYRSSLTEMYTIQIDKLNDVDGIRTNISENEEVSGTITVTANDGGTNAASEIYIDGVKYDTTPVMEDGAYFTFEATGRDSYFHNAVTTTDNEIIASIIKWQYRTLDGQAIKIDNSYFTYNQETGAYDITLRFWAGSKGATVEDLLVPNDNREDFTVSELAMRLINGNVYYPTAIGPDADDTKDKTNLSLAFDAVHSIGDSAGWCPHMDVSFSIPAAEVTAVGAELDTQELADGTHVLKVTNGTSTKEVNFIVDNAEPEIVMGIEDGQELAGNITINPQITDGNTVADIAVSLDGESITAPYATTAYELGKGEHTLSVITKDNAGNENQKTVTFTISNIDIAVNEAGATDITSDSASLYLSLTNAGTDTTAAFYKAEAIDTTKVTTETASGILPYITYTVNVGETKAADTIIASWDGTASNADSTHASTMYVLNTVDGSWDTVATADENGSIKEASFKAAEHVADGKATIIVQCTADSALPDTDTATDGVVNVNDNWDGASVPEDYDFAFAWETDTQYYAEEFQYHFLNMNNWIVDNAEELGIKYIIHTGDIVDDYDMMYEWENADEAMTILDESGIPYGVLAGNHDVAGGSEEYDSYTTYFGEDRFTLQDTYGESYKNNLGHYDLISENGQDFIIVYMSWDIGQNELDWMNEVLARYSDRKAILCFHTYTNVKESDNTYLDYFGKMVQENVVAKNPNVFAVLNGHYHGSSYETAMFDDNNDGINDRTVYQICTDYQSGFEGGSEYVKMLYFDLDDNKIYMNSYSPYFEDYNYYDTEVEVLNVEGASGTGIDAMILDVDFTTDEQSILADSFSAYISRGEVLGTAGTDKTRGLDKITINLDKLTADTEYTWYAVVTNSETGYVKTGLNTFTTKSAGSGQNATNPPADKPAAGDKLDIATGDNNRMWWILVLLGAAGMAAGAGCRRRNKEV